MQWQPRIEKAAQLKLVGMHRKMTFANNQTSSLWQHFMPRRTEIKNRLTQDLISLQVYPPAFNFTNWDMHTEFEKWAAVEVIAIENVPNGMESFIMESGLYAVFDYKGLNTDTRIFQYIFGTWLPGNNKYTLDNRPHFERLGEKYKNNDAASEEEICIPIKVKE
ncbi:MAG TPA: GyrI-like domain-containing protein [Chitinophagaceae bacterium]|nr:GyrI-like domain-containing protein [Chitinophagaceae bacterium]